MVIFSNLQSLNVFAERLMHKYPVLDELNRAEILKYWAFTLKKAIFFQML